MDTSRPTHIGSSGQTPDLLLQVPDSKVMAAQK